MKYAIIKVVNGNFSVHVEGMTNLANAKTNYHGLCQTLWNASDVVTGTVILVDENMNLVENYKESIEHSPTETPTETTDSEE